jgi:hypothetical protein
MSPLYVVGDKGFSAAEERHEQLRAIRGLRCYLAGIARRERRLELRLPVPGFVMPMREFVDSNGVSWRVWNTFPSSRTTLSGEFEHGWLTFESTAGLRRLAPIPANWDSAAPDRLELMCRAAVEVPRRTGPADLEAEAE